jgi:hypothetical protein
MYAWNASFNFDNISFTYTVPMKGIYLLKLLNTENTEILSRLEGV